MICIEERFPTSRELGIIFKLLPRAQRPSGERPRSSSLKRKTVLSYGQQTLTISVLLVLEEKRKRSEFPKQWINVNVFNATKTSLFGRCTRRKCTISAHIFCPVYVPRIIILGNAHVVILDFMMESQVRNEERERRCIERDHHFGDFEFFPINQSAALVCWPLL